MPSYRNHSIDLQSKSNDWFLYDGNLYMMAFNELMMLDSVIRVNKEYYPQTLLEECKYVIRKNKMENFINDDLDLSSSNESDNEIDSDESDSDNETDY